MGHHPLHVECSAECCAVDTTEPHRLHPTKPPQVMHSWLPWIIPTTAGLHGVPLSTYSGSPWRTAMPACANTASMAALSARASARCSARILRRLAKDTMCVDI